MSSGKLTAKQQAFADYYIIHKNATKAARLAGYAGDDNALAVIGNRNLRNAKIAEYIEAAFHERTMGRDEVLARLASIAAGDASDYLRVDKYDSRIVQVDLGKLIQDGKGHLIKRYTVGRAGTTVELYSAHEALRDLARFYKLFGEETQVSVEINVTDHRERILAGIARKAERLTAGEPIEIHSRPIG